MDFRILRKNRPRRCLNDHAEAGFCCTFRALDYLALKAKNRSRQRRERFALAAEEGFEPSQTESESGVLPLHKSAKRSSYYTVKSEFVNTHSEIFEKKQAIF
jgi:hypothetical protein